jgi:L-threonylcarbamoyladenylate synthase
VEFFGKQPAIEILKKVKGAFTVVLPRCDKIPEIVSGGLDTVAVRVPSCRFARRFISACGVPLAAPSANSSGRPSPTQWQHVRDDLDGKIDAIFMGTPTEIGVESTVVKIEPGKILVLRLGGIDTKKLARATGARVEIATHEDDTNQSPGTRFVHYAPNCPFYAVRYGEEAPAVKTAKLITRASLGKRPAKNLYSAIRAAETQADLIICEMFPDTPEFEAVNERILRAADGKFI